MPSVIEQAVTARFIGTGSAKKHQSTMPTTKLLVLTMATFGAAEDAVACDHSRLVRMPKHTHEPWCKVLSKCEAIGVALLATAVNCTTSNTLHLGDEGESYTYAGNEFGGLGDMGFPGRVHLTETQKMCGQPRCMVAVQDLYTNSLTTPEWLDAVEEAELEREFDGFYRDRRRTSASTPAKKDNYEFRAFEASEELVQAIHGLENAASAQLRACLTDAGVKESSLGLPLTIAKMTGSGKVRAQASSPHTLQTQRRRTPSSSPRAIIKPSTGHHKTRHRPGTCSACMCPRFYLR